MLFTIETDTAQEMIHVRATGDMTQTIRKEILVRVNDHVRAREMSRVLIDLVDSYFNPKEFMTGAVELVNFMNEIGIPQQVRFAFVRKEGDAIEHRALYADLVRLHGWKIRYFTDRQEAATWLQCN